MAIYFFCYFLIEPHSGSSTSLAAAFATRFVLMGALNGWAMLWALLVGEVSAAALASHHPP